MPGTQLPWSVIWRPAAPAAAVLAGAGVVAVLAALAYARTMRRRPGLSAALLALRLGVVAALAAILLGPAVLPPALAVPEHPRLTIVVDTSASMQTRDAGGTSRFEYACSHWLTPEILARLRQDFDLHLLRLDASPRPLPEEALRRPAGEIATGRSSRLAEGLMHVLMDAPPAKGSAGLVFISDGRDTEGRPLGALGHLARARGIPVYTVCVGEATPPPGERRLLLRAWPVPDRLPAGQTGRIAVRIDQLGMGESATTLHVRRGGEHLTRLIEFAGRPSVNAAVDIRQDRPGLYEYEVAADLPEREPEPEPPALSPLVPGMRVPPRERPPVRASPAASQAEAEGHTQTVLVEVTDQPIRVLILEGEPFWDTRYLARALRRDERMDVTQVVEVAPSRVQSIAGEDEGGDVGVPRSAEALARYDVVVLGRGMEHLLDPAAARRLADFVAGGGHLVFARGRAYDPRTPRGGEIGAALAALEPVVWGGEETPPGRNLVLRLTPAGRASPLPDPGALTAPGAAWGQAPVLAVPLAGRPKPAATVLAEGGDPRGEGGAGTPAILSMPYGRGSVGAVLAEGLWRWSLSAPLAPGSAPAPGNAPGNAPGSPPGGPYDLLWSNLVRWLALGGEFEPGEQVSLRLSQTNVALGEEVTAGVAARFMPAGDYRPRLEVRDPAGQSREVALSRVSDREARWQATLSPDAAGVYRVAAECSPLQPARQEKALNVYDPGVERLDLTADAAAMRALADQSGGRALYARPDDLLPLLAQSIDAGASRRDGPAAPAEPAWDGAWVLACLLAWLGVEWLARRRAGWL